MSNAWRIPAGFLVAPIAPCYVGAMILGDPQISAWRIAPFMIFVCWFISFLIAAPTYSILQRNGYVSFSRAFFAGFLIAFLVSLGCFLLPHGPHDYVADANGPTIVDGHLTAQGWQEALKGCLMMGALGSAIGIVFWLIACWKPH